MTLSNLTCTFYHRPYQALHNDERVRSDFCFHTSTTSLSVSIGLSSVFTYLPKLLFHLWHYSHRCHCAQRHHRAGFQATLCPEDDHGWGDPQVNPDLATSTSSNFRPTRQLCLPILHGQLAWLLWNNVMNNKQGPKTWKHGKWGSPLPMHFAHFGGQMLQEWG